MSLATTRLAAHVSTHGRPLGVDLATSRSEQAQSFFESLLGWTFSARSHLALVPEPDEEMSAFLDRPTASTYTIARCDGELVAEFISDVPSALVEDLERNLEWLGDHHSSLDPVSSSSLWVPQICVDDLEETLRRVGASGGKVLEVPHLRGDVRVATIADVGGARLSLWQSPPAAMSGDDGTGTIQKGRLRWIELESGDVSSSIAFYRSVFGWESHAEIDADGCPYTIFSNHNHPVAGLIESMLPEVDDSWCPSFSVVDTDVAVRIAVGLGAVVFAEPADILVGRQAVLVDPTGALCGVVGPRPSGFCPL